MFGSRISGTSMAAINLFNFMGAGFFQYFMGFMLDTFESGARTFPAYQAIFLMCVAFMAVSLVLGVLSRETFGGKGGAGADTVRSGSSGMQHRNPPAP
ncbi:MAG: hypothetical protein ABC612_08485, partial [Candidatus Methanosuratincola petrocarbonis]